MEPASAAIEPRDAAFISAHQLAHSGSLCTRLMAALPVLKFA
jgi:hypothetical protein